MDDTGEDTSYDLTYDEDGYCGVHVEDFDQVFRTSNLYDDNNSCVSDSEYPHVQLQGLMSVMHKMASTVETSHLGVANIRRIIWGYFLGAYDATDLDSLVSSVCKKRDHYRELSNKHRYDGLKKMHTLNPQLFHPLAPVERNPWELTQRIKDLLDEIWQDVERTYQERSLFKQDCVRKTLQNILYVWSREHDYISYRQGMNELLAVVYIVCYRDQVHPSEAGGDTVVDVLLSGDPQDLEADAYTLFATIMSLETQLMFDNSAVKSPLVRLCSGVSANLNHIASLRSRTKSEAHNSFMARTKFIHQNIIRGHDMPVYNHFQKIDLEPHIFLMRWIRLIFSREFNINETLNLWDAVFADHFLTKVENRGLPEFQFELIDFFCVAMISYVRLNLLENDINYCLQRLFKFPPIEDISHLIAKAYKIRTQYKKRISDPSGSVYPQVPSCSVAATPVRSTNRDPPRTEQSPTLQAALCVEATVTVTGTTPYASLDGSDAGGSGDPSPSVSSDSSQQMGTREALEDIAARLYQLHEKAFILGVDELMSDIQSLHSDVTRVITNLD
ncbi:TBC domain containing protein, putative [Babesia ovis]|uniref:TBC domain containing protein, putative n=1 Tax=Babesia ovis TaxID=5869 RepID=A0A9W5TBJ7_BABOV|nr:TBC domain containing protein, putative [Babesia ovis]